MQLKYLGYGAALLVGAALIIRQFFSFNLDAPPGLDAEAYLKEPVPSVVQTEITLPLTYVAERAEAALIAENPLKEDVLGPTVFKKKIGVPYTLDLAALTLRVRDRRLEVRAKLNTNLIVPIKLLSKKTKPICGPRFNASAQITPGVRMSNEDLDKGATHGRIAFNFRVGKVRAEIGDSCPGGRKTKLDQAIEKKLLNPLLDVVTKVFQGRITASLERVINADDSAAFLNDALTENVAAAFQSFDLTGVLHEKSPIPLPDDLKAFLTLNPQHAFVGPIRLRGSGRNAQIALTPGIAAIPEVQFTQPEPPEDIFLPLQNGRPGNSFTVNALGKIDLAVAEQQATEIAQTLVAELLPDIRIGDLRVQLYQARERIVVGVHLRGVTWMRLRGSLFLTARPEFDAENQEVRLRDVKFDAISEGYLEKAAAWVLEAPIETALSERLKLSLEPQFGTLMDALADISLTVQGKDLGKQAKGISAVTFNGALDQLTDPVVWLSDNHLNVGITASGTSSLSVQN